MPFSVFSSVGRATSGFGLGNLRNTCHLAMLQPNPKAKPTKTKGFFFCFVFKVVCSYPWSFKIKMSRKLDIG